MAAPSCRRLCRTFGVMASLVVRAVTSELWADFERLFEAKGGPTFCWCMAWRSAPKEPKHPDSSNRKAAMAARVDDGVPIGLLGYLDDQPVAWCSVAPRSTYRRLVSNGTADEGVWSIVCFFVLKQHRGAGLTKRMLAAALTHARELGARVVEAYPVDEDSPSYRFMGFVPMFREAGFREIGREGSRRHVMQRRMPALAAQL
jgi:GNAT superfamily N-acetyltransferase